MTAGEPVILKYGQTLSVCPVGRVCVLGVREGGEEQGGKGLSLKSQSMCVLVGSVAIAFSLWLGKPYLRKHREKRLLAQR